MNYLTVWSEPLPSGRMIILTNNYETFQDYTTGKWLTLDNIRTLFRYEIKFYLWNRSHKPNPQGYALFWTSMFFPDDCKVIDRSKKRGYK